MSDAEIDALLQAEGLENEGADALLEWARSRAAELVAQTQGDPELGPLLREGAEAGVDERATSRKRGTAAEAEVDRATRRGRDAEAEDDDRPARRGRGKRRGRAREEQEQEQAQAHADVVGEAHEGEASAPVETAEAGAPEPEPEPEWKATMHGDEAPEPPHRHEEEATTPRGEGSAAGPLPPIPSVAREAVDEEEIDEIEELDAEEIEMLEEEPIPEPAVDAPTFGPPDGTDEVPAWRAALLAAETGSDREAAELLEKQESGMRPLPATVTEPTPVATERLQAEEDEISQHKIDLSDLDGAPE